MPLTDEGFRPDRKCRTAVCGLILHRFLSMNAKGIPPRHDSEHFRPAPRDLSILIWQVERAGDPPKEAQAAAHALGQKLVIAEAVVESDFDTAFLALERQRVEALLIRSDILSTTGRSNSPRCRRVISRLRFIPCVTSPWRAA